MKDTHQDEVSSADVDERHPTNRNKWDCFDLNLTCFQKPFSLLCSTLLSLCHLFPWLTKPTVPNKMDEEIEHCVFSGVG